MDSPKQEIIVKQPIPWVSILAFAGIVIFLFFYFKGCKGDKKPDIIYVKADSALQEENRRMRDSVLFYKQYVWKTNILQTQLGETEKEIVRLTGTLQKVEQRIRTIVRTDTIRDEGLILEYIDSVVAYRELRDVEKVVYDSIVSSERGFSLNLRKLLDSCRSAVNVIAPAIVKPRGEVYLGLMAATNLGFVFAGPEIMYKDKRDRIYRVGYGVGNSKPWYQAGVAVKLKLRR